MRPHTITLPGIEAMPSVEQIAELSRHHQDLFVNFPSRLASHSVFSQDAPAQLLRTLQEQLLPLVADDRAITYSSWLRGSAPQQRADDGTLESWSSLRIYQTLTEQQVLSHAELLVAAAHEYDVLATDLMTRLALQLGEEPARCARAVDWHPHEQTGHVGEWWYAFHGIHCVFTNDRDGLSVQASLGCQNETGYGFGALEPVFFADFCRAQPVYAHLVRKISGSREHMLRAFSILAKHGYLRCVKILQGWDRGYVVPFPPTAS